MEEVGNLREFTSMNYCINEIPLRVRRGFTIVEVQFTCIDAVEEFIAVGTNIGIVYWCSRSKNKIERLRPEKCGPKITYVKVISSVDHMVAAGDESGAVSIFIIPKEKLLLLPTENGRLPQKSIERFTLSNVHTSSITSIEWSLNGQKLFTGDAKGLVVFTQMDFHLNIIKSTEILNEKFPVVQLSYYQPELLLIATEYRCILHYQGKDGKTIQVGQKDRSSLCKLGGVICGSFSSKPVIYSARPKQCIWLADAEGNVQKTFLFKDALSKQHQLIQIINDNSRSFLDKNEAHNFENTSLSQSAIHQSPSSQRKIPDFEFSNLKFYKNKFLIAFSSEALVILNVDEPSVLAGLYSLRRIFSVAVNKDEIFILEGYRKIRRLATQKDVYWHLKPNVPENATNSPIGEKLLDIVSKIKEEASANVVKPIMHNLAKSDLLINEKPEYFEPISPAEDAFLALTTGGDAVFSYNDGFESDNLISQHLDDDDIVFNRKKKISTETKEPVIGESSEKDVLKTLNTLALKGSDEKSFSSTSKKIISVEIKQDADSFTSPTVTTPSKQIPEDILPDLRNIDSILEDVKYKENQLAALLNIDMDSEISYTSRFISHSIEQKSEVQEREISEIENYNDADSIISPLELLNNSDENLCKNQDYCQTTWSQTETKDENEYKTLAQTKLDEHSVNSSDAVQIENATNSLNNFVSKNNFEDSWVTCHLPNISKWICVTNSGLYCSGPKSTVYYSDTKDLNLQWKLQNFRAVKMSVSLSKHILWKLDLGVAYAYSGDLVNRWILIARNVESIAVSDDIAWYVADGNVYAQFNLTAENPYSEESTKINCPEKISKICCFENTVWALSKRGRIWSKRVIRDSGWSLEPWKKISHPSNVTISNIALGCKNTGWIVTQDNEIYFTTDFIASDDPNWWQIIFSSINHKNNSKLSNQLNKFVNWSIKENIGSSIASSDRAIWVLHHGENILRVNQTVIEGHHWFPFSLETSNFVGKWKFLCGSGLSEISSILWCLSTNNDLFLLNPLTKQFRAIDVPTTEDIVSVAAVPGSLWVLTKDGEIYSRLGINRKNYFGSLWAPMSFKNANNLEFKFQHLSLGNDVIWAVDYSGEVFCTGIEPSHITIDHQIPDWIHVKNISCNEMKFSKVFVGPDKNSGKVWALDTKNNIYVRQGIFSDFQFGTEWILVSGIRAVHIVISVSTVWALTPEGNVYRRFGVSKMNYIGDYWLRIPGLFSVITVSIDDVLWGITNASGDLHKYEKHLLNLLERKDSSKKNSESTDEDWELV